ncbi:MULTISPECIES: hypothetical protein [Streptomyces]|uniref:ATP-grasp domain-containing protein n=1 Tax=Streptomyces rimosus subsp. rimosus TaxID=132474 RepID=A0ABY3ZES8_STRRM|nr:MULTISPECIES: hypothetical protein [Streptomyces]UNZ08350.1 hypothetical protein SRIMR7_39975 [Streptomyces rimosus subsp. rimosus]
MTSTTGRAPGSRPQDTEDTPLSGADAEEADLLGTVNQALRRLWSGRGVVLLLDDFDHRATSLVGELRACGARVEAVLSRTGPGPGAPAVPHSRQCRESGPEMTRPEFEAWLRNPSQEVRRWLDGLDPERRWLALGTPRTGVAEFLGRKVYGWRRPKWAAVEDKTTIDRLWDAAGVASPPHVVVDVEALRRAPEEIGIGKIAGPAGVVAAADSTRGHVGDSLGLRWVPDPDRFQESVRDLADRADRVRIARFADGVPCSVLGMALPDGIAVFAPIEIVTLGDPATGRLLFCGSSTHWRPGASAEREMRDATRRAGRELVRTTGYRGIFSVDGLLTPDGFTATELNPRHASGLGLRAALPDFPVYLFNRAVQEELPGLEGIRSAALERVVRRAVAAAPSYALTVPVARTGHADGAADGAARLRHGGSVIDYRTADGVAALTAISPPAPGHRAGPACAALAAHLGDPGLRCFPLGTGGAD